MKFEHPSFCFLLGESRLSEEAFPNDNDSLVKTNGANTWREGGDGGGGDGDGDDGDGDGGGVEASR